MGWAKFDDRRHTNGKLVTAGLAANGLDANGITYAAANRTQGFVPRGAVHDLAPGISRRAAQRLVRRLEHVGRWISDPSGDGWWIEPDGWMACGGKHRPKIAVSLRDAVMERDKRTCKQCGATDDLTLDHRTAWSLGGPSTMENLRVLCRPCNSRKGTSAE